MIFQVIAAQETLSLCVKLAPTIITSIVGIFGCYIAYNQYRTNKDKLRLDLFGKRLEAYENLQKYFNLIYQRNLIDEEALNILAEARYKSIFLFGDDIATYLDEVLEKALKLLNLQTSLQSITEGEQRKKLFDEKTEIVKWHEEQRELKSSIKRYANYMIFKDN
jgi:hypothetical protein